MFDKVDMVRSLPMFFQKKNEAQLSCISCSYVWLAATTLGSD